MPRHKSRNLLVANELADAHGIAHRSLTSPRKLPLPCAPYNSASFASEHPKAPENYFQLFEKLTLNCVFF